MKALLVSVAVLFAATSLYAQTIKPGMSKHEIIDSLKAHRVWYKNMVNPPGNGPSSFITVETMGYDGMEGKMEVQFTSEDKAAMVTYSFDAKSEADYNAYLAEREKLSGPAQKFVHDGTLAIWMQMNGGIMTTIGYDHEPKQMNISQMSMDLMKTIIYTPK